MTSKSPVKRTKGSHAGDGAAADAVYAIFASDQALLDTIVSYIPVELKARESFYDHEDVPVDSMLATIASLCRAFPSLGKRLGPHNKDFWCAMVLSRFDFRVCHKNAFNVEDWDDGWIDRGPDAENDKGSDNGSDIGDQQAKRPVHPIRAAITKWHLGHPDTGKFPPGMLANDLAFWPAIGAYFRPAEFQFLGAIQRGELPNNMNSWPAHEDAFSLYHDFVLLQNRLAKFDSLLETCSDGDAYVLPCLLSRLPEDTVATNGGYELLKHCDYLPHYWDGYQHNKWTGLDVPLPDWKEIDQAKNGKDPWELQTHEEKCVFPCMDGEWSHFERLRRVVHESFVDWRHLHVGIDESPSPEFYIGESKVSHRWLGFVGESSYCRYTPGDRDSDADSD